MKYLDIIKAPVVTEKSALLNEKNEYAFFVDVKEIRTINVHPRKRRVGRYTGLTNRKKKAIVTLEQGQTINLG